MAVKNGLRTFKCLEYSKTYQKKFDEDLLRRLQNTYKFCYRHINQFCLMLQKGVYQYEYVDGWKRFNETSLKRKVILQQSDTGEHDRR